ncbi:MAG: rRNA maturation RNase YbeY [Pseudomonadota bacterium]|nr:rRNA maturation RNase YbeY [Pseudomonadota bacterium]
MPTTSARRKTRIAVQFAVPRRGLPSAASLRDWALAASGAEVTLRVVGEREARQLNTRFREKNSATNVLSFAYGSAQGDVVLCHPVIAREARAQGRPLAAHYAHLVVHGVLHLRGYDHEKKRDAFRMARQESLILRRIGFADPYALE